MNEFIAMDGGGTKTDVVWFNEAGEVLGRVIGKSTNPNGQTYDTVKAHLKEMIDQLIHHHGLNPLKLKNVFAGVAGGSHPEVQKQIKAILRELLPEGIHIKVDHDAINALWSGTHGEPGMVLIAGTGSVVYGVNEEDKAVRIGGWGHLIGDEGSGYDMGRRAATAVMKAYDGRGETTILSQLLLEKCNVTTEEDLIPIIYSGGKTYLASLVPLVADAARSGDAVALDIIEEAAVHLTNLVNVGVRHFREGTKQVVFVGGLTQLGDLLLRPLKRSLLTSEMEVILPDLPPVYGAAVECMRMEGLKLSPSFIKKFYETIS